MPEIIPFGQYKGKSVEQIVLKDYKYFGWVINNVPIKIKSLGERFDYVDEVVNNFVSTINCVNCDDNLADKISIYEGYNKFRGSDLGHIYCSSECYDSDPSVSEKSILHPLGFKSALSPSKSDTNQLVDTISACMGLRKNRKTKEYLEDFFDNVQLRGFKSKEESNDQLSFF